MALKAIVTADEFGQIPEPLQEHYVQDGESYRLDAEGVEDVSGLKSALERQKLAAKEFKDQGGQLRQRIESMESLLANLGGEEGAVRLQELQSKIEKDELLKDMTNGNLELVTQKLISRNNKDWETKYSGIEAKLAEIEAEKVAKEKQLQQVIINGELRRAATPALITPAIDDAVMLGSQLWRVGESGKPELRNNEGELEMGKDGKPLTMGEWLEGLKETRPHWFLGSSGGGTQGGRPGGDSRITEDQIANMSMAEYVAKRKSGEIK